MFIGGNNIVNFPAFLSKMTRCFVGLKTGVETENANEAD